MRKTLSLLCLVALLGLALPAQAQLRADVQTQQAPTKLYASDAPGFTLNRLFSPQHFRMQHSFEFSSSSFGGQTASMGMYTNTMLWQFNQKLAARVDVGVAQPFGGNAFGFSDGQNQPQVFLRNAEVAYRPADNVQLHFQIRQNPYGYAANPYYSGSPYYGYRMHPYSSFGLQQHDLFWKDDAR